MAANGTWIGIGSNYNDAGNWDPAGVPSVTAFFDLATPLSITFSLSNTSVGGWSFSGAANYTFALSAAQTFSFINTGIQILGGTQTFNNGGTLQFEASSTAGALLINNDNILRFFNSSNAGTAQIANSGLVQFNNASTASQATITNNGGTIVFLNTSNGGSATFVNNSGGLIDFHLTTGTLGDNKITAGSIEGAGDYDLGANKLTVGNAGNQTVSGVISGVGGALAKIGAGKLTLSGDNTYNAGTTISNGTIQLGSGGTSGSIQGNVAISSGAHLIFDRCNTYTFDGAISGDGDVAQAGTGTTKLTAVNTYKGATTISAGTLALVGSGSIADSSRVDLSGTATFSIYATSSGASIVKLTGSSDTHVSLGHKTLTLTGEGSTFNGVIGGYGGSLTKDGTGTLTLTAAQAYTGETTINNGATIALTVNGSVASASGVTANGTFDVSNISPADANIKSLAGSGSVIIGGKNLVITCGDGDVFSGAITGVGPGGVKLLDGTQTLTGPNNYTGGTFIVGGTLIGTTTSLKGFIQDDSHLVFDQDFNGTYAGILNGTGTLKKEGTGVVTLSNGNGYTGATYINEGVLGISALNNLGATSHIFFDGGTLRLTASGLDIATPITLKWNGGAIDTFGNNDTISGTIDGPGGLTKISTGTLTLTNVDTYCGATNIVQGTLALSGSGSIADSSTVLADGTFNVSAVTAPDVYIKSLDGGGSVVLGGKILHLTCADGAFNGVISGAGGLTLDYGTEVLGGANTYMGATAINNGTLIVAAANALGGTSGLTFNGGTLQFNVNGVTLNKPITLSTYGGTVNTNGNNETLSGIISGTAPGVGHLTKSGDGILTLTAANTYTGGTTVTGGVLRGTTTSLKGDILDNANVTFDQSFDGTYNTGNITGSGSVTKAGSGEVILFGSNNYAGGTNINGGSLSIGGAANIGGGGISFNTGTLKFTNSFGLAQGITLTAGGGTVNTLVNDDTLSGIIAGTGSLTKTGAGVLTLLNSGNTYSGGTNINAGTVSISSASNLGTGGIVFNGGTLLTTSSIIAAPGQSVTLNGAGGTIDTGGNSDEFGGSFSGSGGLTKTGSGTLILAANTGYSGGTTIAAGTLQVGNGGTTGTLQNSGSVANSGVLAFNRSDTSVYSGAISGSGSVHQFGNGVTVLNGANTYIGGTTIDFGGTLQVGNGAATGSILGNVLDNGTLAFSRSNAYTFAGAISGTGAVEKSGVGTLTLAGANSYGGGTTVNLGGLSISADNNLGNGGLLALKNGTTLSLTDSFDLTHAITVDGSASFQVSSGKQTTVSSVIADGSSVGSLIKTGAGTLELDNANTYSGGTTISAGTLLVDGTIAGLTTVNNGGTLGGNGFAGDVSVANGGILSPGASAGILSTGTVTLVTGASFKVELNGTDVGTQYDQLDVFGSVNLGGSTLSLMLAYTPNVGDTFIIIANDGVDAISGIFAGHADGSSFVVDTFVFQIDYQGGDGNDVELTVLDQPPPPPGPIIGTPQADNPLNGTASGETINGKGGNDVIHGLGGNDIIIGAGGKDTLFGEEGADVFKFNKVGESKVGAQRDTISDFEHGTDLINLRSIDANTLKVGNQNFAWIGKQAFHKKAGELHIVNKGTGHFFVEGDTNGDGKADFQINVHTNSTLDIADFVR